MGDAAISPDGRYVVFQSDAENLAVLDGNSRILLKDLQSGAISIVDVNQGGSTGPWQAYNPVVSANGAFVAFGTFSNSTQ